MVRVTGRPVFGVVPNLSNLDLPEEDSVTFKSGVMDQKKLADRIAHLGATGKHASPNSGLPEAAMAGALGGSAGRHDHL